MKNVRVLGVDLGKNSCSTVGMDAEEAGSAAPTDAAGEHFAEAATRPTMRFVALKSEAQLDVQVLHRVRDRLVGQRTSLMNQMRSILSERGISVAQGRRSLLDALAALSQRGQRDWFAYADSARRHALPVACARWTHHGARRRVR